MSASSTMLAVAAGAVLVCAVVTLWRRSLRAVVRVLAIQGVALGAVGLILGAQHHDGGLIGVAGIDTLVMGVVIPLLVVRAVAVDPASREAAPLVNVPASLVGAAALTFLAYATTRPVVALIHDRGGHLVPLGLATVLIGFFAMTVRRHAVSQIVGLLLVDNGITLIALLATSGVPLIVELGVSLDVLLVVVVLQVLTAQLRTRFAVIDLDELRELHD